MSLTTRGRITHAAVSRSSPAGHSTTPIEKRATMDKLTPSTPAPIAPRHPHEFTAHGITVRDDYAWLKDARWQEVLRDPTVLDGEIRQYLEAENAHTEGLLGYTAGLQKA